MIGLEYVLQLYGMQHQELADKLGIRKQNIHLWISGKQNVSKKYLPTLSQMFGMPQEYFQKEIDESDKLKIQGLKIKHEIKSVDTSNVDVNSAYMEKLDELFGTDEKLIGYEIKKRLDEVFKFEGKHKLEISSILSCFEMMLAILDSNNSKIQNALYDFLWILTETYKLEYQKIYEETTILYVIPSVEQLNDFMANQQNLMPKKTTAYSNERVEFLMDIKKVIKKLENAYKDTIEKNKQTEE